MSEPTPPKVRFVGEAQAVPVFNCRVIVAPPNDAGLVVARAAELEGLSVSAQSQREALQKLVAAFKARMAEHVAKQEEIPWIRPGDKAQPGEQELFIAVHL
jgi:hypothetical protein